MTAKGSEREKTSELMRFEAEKRSSMYDLGGDRRFERGNLMPVTRVDVSVTGDDGVEADDGASLLLLESLWKLDSDNCFHMAK